jgi:hypothetical protein
VEILPVVLGMRVGGAAFKKGSIPRAVGMPPHPLMHCTLPPSEPPDGEHPCCLRLAAVGGARPRGGWRSSVIARLQGFSSRSPTTVPHQLSSVGMITRLVVGGSKPGCGLCPVLSFKDVHNPGWGRGHTELGPASAWAGDPLLPPAFGIEGHPPALRRRRPPAMRGKANCCFLDRVQLSVLHPGKNRAARGPATSRSSLRRRLPRGSHNTPYAARAVLVFWDGPFLVLVARTGVRTCRCALGQPPLAGVVLVRRWPLSSVLRWWLPEEVSPPTIPSCHLRSDLLLFGFDGLSSPLVWGRGQGPFHSSVCPEAIAAAV